MWPQPTDKADILRFVGVGIALCGLVAFVAHKKYGLFGLIPLGGFAFLVFVAFKHGYVRHDGHEVAATNLLLFAALLWLPVSWCIVWQTNRWLTPVVLLPLVFAVPLASLSLTRYAAGGLWPVLSQQFTPRNLFAPAQTLREDKQQALRSFEAYAAGLRTAFPNLHLHGTADVYPLSQTLGLPADFTCRSRPIFQSYSAYTPRLAEMNAAHLRKRKAADHIFFDVSTIDGRFTPQDDSLSWPELLTRYDVAGTAGPYIHLQKSPIPRQYALTPIGKLVANFDETIKIPSISDGPIWVQIEIRRSLWGNILATLYRPPRVLLSVVTRGGKTPWGRLLPAEARAGFLLSPVIDNRQSFVALASTDWQRKLADLEVTSVRLGADGGKESASRYQTSPVRVRFYRLDFPRHDLIQPH